MDGQNLFYNTLPTLPTTNGGPKIIANPSHLVTKGSHFTCRINYSFNHFSKFSGSPFFRRNVKISKIPGGSVEVQTKMHKIIYRWRNYYQDEGSGRMAGLMQCKI